ncbi:MAG TPA: hypothetical protein VG603_11515 [Chitinophagales bacterium]|nr:hypothetical protein [Chitinophagales bacterium]
MKTLLCFLLTAYTLLLSAQTVDVSNGVRLPVKISKFRIIGKNNDGLVVRLYGSEDVIDVFDESLKLVTTRNIDFKSESGLLQYIMLNKTGAVIFYLAQDKKYSVLLAQPVNSKFIELGKPIAVDTIYDRRDLVAANIRFKPSVDQNHLMVYYPFFEGSTLKSIRFMCVDRSLRLLYNKTVTINRDEKELEESKTLIDNFGNSYMLLKPETKTGEMVYDVYCIAQNGSLLTYSITADRSPFGEPWFDIDNKNNNLVMCSLYNSGQSGEDVANGFSYTVFDPLSGKVLRSAYTPFSEEFIKELTNREPAGPGKLYTFTIRKVILRNDGGALILAESYIKDSRETPVGVGFQPGFYNYHTSNIYQFNDIIAFSVDSAAQLGWYSVMRKKQASEDDNGLYSSFLTVNQKDKLRLIYMDDIATTGIINEYVLSSDGKNERRVLINQEDKDVMLLPKLGKQTAPDEVVLPSYINGVLKMAKITY